jgi:hypothetical protein
VALTFKVATEILRVTYVRTDGQPDDYMLPRNFSGSIKSPFGILYSVSVYSGSLSYYGSLKSAQDTNLHIYTSVFNQNSSAFIVFLVSIQYFRRKFSKPSVSSRYSRNRKVCFASRPFGLGIVNKQHIFHKS